jgi:hypothetical protein
VIGSEVAYKLSMPIAAGQPDPASKGLCCTPDGLFYGPGIPLVTRDVLPDGLTQTTIRPQREIEAVLSKALGSRLDLTDRINGLRAVADALDDNDLALASIAAVQLRIPDLPDEAAVARLLAGEAMTKYNPDWPTEPRDWHGRWTTDGGDATAPTDDRATGEAAYVIPAVYNGRYHDFVVDEALKYMRQHGLTTEKEMLLTRLDGKLSARADLIVLNPQTKEIELIEVKTGDDPPYTINQRQIYPLALIGGHVYSDDPRIRRFGYQPKQLLPPMKGWTMYVPAAGKKIEMYPLILEFD